MFIIRTRVQPSRIHGTGVFADEHVAAGSVVWRFQPPFDQVLSAEDVAGLPDIARGYLQTYAYRSVDLGGSLVLSGDHARFLNHSDDPNTEERTRLSIARRPIFPGDEITCDYRVFCTDWTEFDFKPNIPCSKSMMTDEEPHRNLYTRLKASTHGIGVFAIRNIPTGLHLFEGDFGSVVHVPRAVVERIESEEVRRMYFDFCPTQQNTFVAPANLNQLTMAWYLNHSEHPNVLVDQNMRFAASRAIFVGEELLINYAKFSEHAPAKIAQWKLAK